MSEVRQRWRIVFARGEEARYLSHLDAVKAWERAFRRGDIPIATSEGFSPRPRLVFAAPLSLGMLADHELADLYLAEKLTAFDLRARLDQAMPPGYEVVDLYDVWSGAPALAPRLVAADYRMTLLNVEPGRLVDAAERLMAAARLPRERLKETRTVKYDLRPLLLAIRVGPPDALPEAERKAARDAEPDAGSHAAPDADAASAVGLWVRLRHSQDLGSGRPDEVVAALAEEMGLQLVGQSELGENAGANSAGASRPSASPPSASPHGATPAAAFAPAVEVFHPVRERLWLDDELDVATRLDSPPARPV